MNEFLNHWNKTPEKETIVISKKFIYPDENNIEQQIKAILLPATSSVRKSDAKIQYRP